MIRPTPRASAPASAFPAIHRRGDVVLLDMGEQLVIRGRQEFRDIVLQELEKGERKFVIDFARTGYIDSAGLGVLIAVSKQIRAEGGELTLTNLNEDLRSLFHLTKLDTLFGIIEPGVDRAGAPVAPISLASGGDIRGGGLTSGRGDSRPDAGPGLVRSGCPMRAARSHELLAFLVAPRSQVSRGSSPPTIP